AAFAKYGVLLSRSPLREANLARAVDVVLRQLDGQDPIALKHSGEQAVPIIESLSGLNHGEFIVNIPNQGQIHGLADGVVVECMASIDRDGVHPRMAPDLPTGVIAWVQTHVAAQELVVAASLERRFDLALQAVRLDPL